MNLSESIELVERLQAWRETEKPTHEEQAFLADSESITEAINNVLKAAKAAQKLFAQEPTKPTKK